MNADVVVFTYKGRIKKRDIQIKRAFRGEADYHAVVTSIESLFGRPDVVEILKDQDLASHGDPLKSDLERLSGIDSKKTSPS